MAIQSGFIEDLKFVYEQDHCKNVLSGQFLSELSKVYLLETPEKLTTNEEFSSVDLISLSFKLDALRTSIQSKVNDKKKNLLEEDEQNPLFCEVSLYAPMDYGRLEVAHTRTLAWLLDPTKEHEFGDALLKGLLPLFNIEFNNHFIINSVQSEQIHHGDNDEMLGRTDLWIEGTWNNDSNRSFLVVIEAKISAPEGKDQLKRYEKAIKKSRIEDVFPIFLTPDGCDPKGRKYREWKPVSFGSIACRLAFVSKHLKKKQGYHFLRFYIASIIRDILDWKLTEKVVKANPYLLLSCLNQMKGEILS